VDYTTTGVSDLALSHLPKQNLPILDQNIFVFGTSPVSLPSVLEKSDELDFRHQKAENLLSGPQRLGLEDCGLRDGVTVLDPHHQVHQILMVDKSISLGKK